MYACFGVALLLPWNATLAAMDYFIDIFPNHNPSFTFLLAVSVPMLGMQIVSFFLQKFLSVEFKLITCLLLNCLVTACVAFIPAVISNENNCYFITLGLMIIQGCSIAFLQSALYGIAGISTVLTNRLMIGIGMGSVLMNFIRMLFLWLVNSKKTGAIVFFSLSSAYIFACFILSLVFLRSYKKA